MLKALFGVQTFEAFKNSLVLPTKLRFLLSIQIFLNRIYCFFELQIYGVWLIFQQGSISISKNDKMQINSSKKFQVSEIF